MHNEKTWFWKIVKNGLICFAINSSCVLMLKMFQNKQKQFNNKINCISLKHCIILTFHNRCLTNLCMCVCVCVCVVYICSLYIYIIVYIIYLYQNQIKCMLYLITYTNITSNNIFHYETIHLAKDNSFDLTLNDWYLIWSCESPWHRCHYLELARSLLFLEFGITGGTDWSSEHLGLAN